MKRLTLILASGFLVILIFNSCEKDNSLYPQPNQETWATGYAAEAEALLALMPADELALLTAEDIAAFKKGPDQDAIAVAERSSTLTNQRWHGVLAIFYGNTVNGAVQATGPWYGRRNADLLIEQNLDMQNGFEGGTVAITDHNGHALHLSFGTDDPFPVENGRIKQNIRAVVEKGTGIFFEPQGMLDLGVYMRPGRTYPVVILARGWIYYGLNVEPVPTHFEESFPVDYLEAHYTYLENTPAARPMYIEVQSDFWVYPTADPAVSATRGIGEGMWEGKQITFVVDQTLVGDLVNDPENVVGQGRLRIYMGPRDDYMNTEYIEACNTNMMTPVGGRGLFELRGGTESFYNYRGSAMGIWVDQTEFAYGIVPPQGTFPPDLVDDGFLCTAYGSTQCYGLCVPVASPYKNTAYIIGYLEKRSTDRTVHISSVKGTAEVRTDVTMELPDGKVFTGAGTVPFDFSFGGYSGEMQLVVVEEIETLTGSDYFLVHYFTDGTGNSFWTSDFARETEAELFYIDGKLTVVGGTGDFACARGMLRTEVILGLEGQTLDYEYSGKLSWGCE